MLHTVPTLCKLWVVQQDSDNAHGNAVNLPLLQIKMQLVVKSVDDLVEQGVPKAVLGLLYAKKDLLIRSLTETKAVLFVHLVHKPDLVGLA